MGTEVLQGGPLGSDMKGAAEGTWSSVVKLAVLLHDEL